MATTTSEPARSGTADRAGRLRTSVYTGRGALLVPRHVTMVAFAAAVLVIGLTGSASTRYGLILATVYAIAIVGNNAIASTLNEINLSATAFLALGSYITANALEREQNIVVALLLAIAGCAAIGFLVAIPTSRLGGIQTALVTFALAYSVIDLASYLKDVTGGDNGKFVFVDTTIAGSVVSGSEPAMLIVVVASMLVVGAIHLRVLNSRAGRVAISVGESEQAAAVFGIRTRLVKVLVWTYASAIFGFAGFLLALTVGFVASSQWTIMISILIFVGGLIGGTRSITGAWIGGIVVAGMPLWLQNLIPASSTTIAFGLILLLALLAGGKGIAELGERVALNLYLRRGGRK
jgi:branched-chain amino acid transport system permease protein